MEKQSVLRRVESLNSRPAFANKIDKILYHPAIFWHIFVTCIFDA
jgi:hypothetical protein